MCFVSHLHDFRWKRKSKVRDYADVMVSSGIRQKGRWGYSRPLHRSKVPYCSGQNPGRMSGRSGGAVPWLHQHWWSDSCSWWHHRSRKQWQPACSRAPSSSWCWGQSGRRALGWWRWAVLWNGTDVCEPTELDLMFHLWFLGHPLSQTTLNSLSAKTHLPENSQSREEGELPCG